MVGHKLSYAQPTRGLMIKRDTVELIKRHDEHECVFSCTNNSPIDFLLACCDEIKLFLEKRKQEVLEQQKKVENEQ